MNIYESITKIMEEIPAIGKGKTNKTQGFKYRGIDDVMNVLQPLLAKYKVFIVPQILEQTREERLSSKGGNLIYSICKIKYIFYAEDGTSIEAITIGEGMDSGDKATNKAMAIAMKYALFQVFCIPTAEMKDPDGETPDESIKIEQPPKITKSEIDVLYDIVEKNGISNEKVISVLNKYGYNKFAEIKMPDIVKVRNELKGE